jgi:hypothetical protein
MEVFGNIIYGFRKITAIGMVPCGTGTKVLPFVFMVRRICS